MTGREIVESITNLGALDAHVIIKIIPRTEAPETAQLFGDTLVIEIYKPLILDAATPTE